MECYGQLPDGRTTMSKLEFDKPPLEVRRRNYRELRFLLGTI